MALPRRHLIARLIALAVVAALLGPVPPAGAQEPAASETTVRLLSWHGLLPDLILDGGGAPVPAQADESLGLDYTIRRDGPMLKISRKPAAGGGKETVPLAVIDLPVSLHRAIILLMPSPAGSPLPLTGRVLDDSPEAQPADSFRMVNLSTQATALRLGKDTATVAPGAEKVFSYAGLAAPHLLFQLAVRQGGNWTVIRRSLQAAPRGQRVFCLLRDGRPDPGRIGPEKPPPAVQAIFMISRSPAPAKGK